MGSLASFEKWHEVVNCTNVMEEPGRTRCASAVAASGYRDVLIHPGAQVIEAKRVIQSTLLVAGARTP